MDFLQGPRTGAVGQIVNWCLAALAIAFVLPASAADWRDELKPAKPGKFPLPRAQTCVYRFGWGALSAAEAKIEFSTVAKEQLQASLTAKTIGAARALWQLDIEHTAKCSSKTLLPISVLQVEKYRRSVEKTKLDFTPTEVTRLLTSEPEAKKPKPKRFKFPNVADLYTSLLLIRSQELKDGDNYSLVIYPDRDGYVAHVNVVGRESIKVAGQRYSAVKMQLALQQVTKKMALKPHPRFKTAYAWLSDDKDRTLLQVRAEVCVGSVWMELESVKFAQQ
jgi:hypothetical protein